MRPRNVSDTVFVVTGASSGIGRCTALEVARKKGTIVMASRQESALRELEDECRELGGRPLAVPTDVRDEQAVKNLARKTVEHFGRIDVWVNNAAVSLFARIEEAPYEDYRRVIETNLFGYVHGARAVIPCFREQGTGVLINISSVVGKVAQPYTSAYVASKFAIVGLSESLRMELMDAPEIHVCTVLPASIDTPLFQHAGNFTGKAIKPMDPIYGAEKVARTILQLSKRPRREVYVGNAGRQVAALHSLAPRLAEWGFARFVESRHFQDSPERSSSGNLFEPMPAYNSVGGGWRNGAKRRQKLGAALGLALLAGLGMGAYFLFGFRTKSTPERLLEASQELWRGAKIRAAGKLAWK
jgi:short-subunit dehydrogenase